MPFLGLTLTQHMSVPCHLQFFIPLSDKAVEKQIPCLMCFSASGDDDCPKPTGDVENKMTWQSGNNDGNGTQTVCVLCAGTAATVVIPLLETIK